MLNSSQAIDISAFPEPADTALVVDAFLEAKYQNPLILGIKDVGMDTANSILYVKYDYDELTTKAKREELAENDFKYVDEMYNDSFTAYGVLVNNVGVCASYSAAFKLLADAAGLDSIVVTGYLDGNLPHAWNKVQLDGQWNIVDSTNNDNDVIQNALFNLSDNAAYATLVEDNLMNTTASLITTLRWMKSRISLQKSSSLLGTPRCARSAWTTRPSAKSLRKRLNWRRLIFPDSTGWA